MDGTICSVKENIFEHRSKEPMNVKIHDDSFNNSLSLFTVNMQR